MEEPESAAPAAARLYFEDFKAGDRFETPSATVSEAEIIEFARRYDPKPYHTDPETARATATGGLIASGLHTLALSFGLFFRLGLLDGHLASPGFDSVRFHKPLRPGDTIRQVAEVLEVRSSRSKPDRGLVRMRHETVNQRDEVIMTVSCLHVVYRRGIA